MDGWNCPKCGGAHAPWVATCPVVVSPSYTPPVVIPLAPTQPPGWWQQPVTSWPANGLGNVWLEFKQPVNLCAGDTVQFTSTLTV